MESAAFSASIKKDSKNLYLSTNYLVSTPNGTYVKVGKNEIFYQVESSRTLQLKKKFVCHGDYITIKGDYTSQISRGDSAKLYFAEKEAVSIGEVVKGAPKRAFGEIFAAQGGHQSSSRDNLTGFPASIRIGSVDKKGFPQECFINEGGRYLTPPSNPVEVTHEDGTTLELNIEFDDASETSVFERDFQHVEFRGGLTKLHMSYPFPTDIQEGEMILSKTVFSLSQPYSAEGVDNVPCQTSSDFSPINKIPLMPPSCIAPHSIYNKAMETIDIRLMELEREITRLKAKN
jgi:hypothetical protein